MWEVYGAPARFSGAPEVPSKSKKSRTRAEWQRAITAVIKASREDADLSRQELADRLGLTYSQIVNIENSRRAVGLIDFIMLADAIGVEPAALFDRIMRW
jgi:ribosome-binding protein aMBF1 (putative translation factor)